ncbi:MAG: toxin, partial [Chloroflexi bacterium]|nr:toxin [Chloroflexota bacterium]
MHSATLSGATAGTVVSASAYTATGQLTLLALGGGSLQTAFTYDPLMQRLTQLRTITAGGTLQELSYTYDPVGNVASITDGQGPGGAPVQQFGYDSLDRLVSAAATGGAGGTYEHEYGYDEMGNITSKAGV